MKNYHGPQGASTPPWSAEAFLDRNFPPKETLIDGLLFRRDIIALAGRRRHGKTTFLLNLGVSMALGLPEYLKYEITQPYRVFLFLLEDDAREIQDKLARIRKGRDLGERLALLTREYFYTENLMIEVSNKGFQSAVRKYCADHKPDLVVFDNMAQMIGAEYNNSRRIHELTKFAWALTSDYNCAVLLAAHPKKQSHVDDDGRVSIREDPEGFFEQIMGSSHFVNSCGSLWGLQRNIETDRTDFLGGAQRFTGQQSIATLMKDDDDWFQIVSELEENIIHATNTPVRKAAWKLLSDQPFTYLEGYNAVRSVMHSQSTFYAWWKNFLLRLNLVIPQGDRYVKAKMSSTDAVEFEVEV